MPTPYTTVLPHGVELIDESETSPWSHVWARSAELVSQYCDTATESQRHLVQNAVEQFRNDFSCGKAVKLTAGPQIVYEAYDSPEKIVDYILRMQAANTVPTTVEQTESESSEHDD